MKAWEDLASDTDRSLCWTQSSDWYMDMGVKIERFHKDGRIEIKNVMTFTDSFEDVSDDLYEVFKSNGWMEGCIVVNIEVCQSKLLRINSLIKSHIGSNKHSLVEPMIEKRLFIQKKINKYRNLLTKND